VTAFIRAPVTVGEEAGEEEPKPEGFPRVLGELVTCPYCVGLWIAAGFSYGLVLFPRQTRFVTALFGAQAIADFLNASYAKTRDT
jgi:Protein of unknown function (DUF1360)